MKMQIDGKLYFLQALPTDNIRSCCLFFRECLFLDGENRFVLLIGYGILN